MLQQKIVDHKIILNFFILFRLLDVCHGQRLEREKQLVLFLVFEHLEQDLSGYIDSLPSSGMPARTLQVGRHCRIL